MLTLDEALSYVLYMTRFHPLAKYPGPLLAKLTDLYSVWHAIHGTRHSDFYELHQRYGEIVRWGPNSVSINNVSALNFIYNAKANVKKASWYNAFNSISIFSAVDKGVHARKRRVMTHAFSEQAVRGIQPYITSSIREWCTALGDSLEPGKAPPKDEEQWSEPRDMRHWSAYVIFDALGELLFGESFRTVSRSDNRFFLELMASNSRLINITGQMPILGRLNLSTVFTRAHKERRAKQFGFLRAKLQKRLALGPDSEGRRDIIYYLQQGKDSQTGQGYTEAELMGEAALLLGAGENISFVA
jgi:cytochrome P450